MLDFPSPKGATLHSGATLLALFVARECQAARLGDTSAPFCYPRVQHDTLGRHFRTFRYPRVQHDTLGRHFRTFRYPRVQHDTLGRHFRTFLSLKVPLFVSRTRRLAHETASEDPPVSRSRLFTHETAAKDTRGNRGAFSASYGTLWELYGRSSMPPRFDQSQWDS